MQTFLPYPSFCQSAAVLDYRRLGKQRIEAKQIYLSLTTSDYGWKNHPAVLMWKGYESALLQYGLYICDEWRKRGYQDNQFEFFDERLSDFCEIIYPKWLGNEQFHISHQSNLLRKDYLHYSKYFSVRADLPYFWPVTKNS